MNHIAMFVKCNTIAYNMFSKFKTLADETGSTQIATKILGFNPLDEMEGSIADSLMALVVIGVILMIMGIILGNLDKPLGDAIPDNSTFAPLKTSIPSNLNSAMNVAVIIPIILAAVIILGVVQLLRRGGQ